jgi:hypothetical protein
MGRVLNDITLCGEWGEAAGLCAERTRCEYACRQCVESEPAGSVVLNRCGRPPGLDKNNKAHLRENDNHTAITHYIDMLR